MELQERLAYYSRLVDERLREVVRRGGPAQRLYQMIAYHLGWLDRSFHETEAAPGKRLRPALCFLVCEALGAPPERAIPGAVAVELVHNFSLVHDDIQDRSPVRRHRETVWHLWGVAHGINVGDAIFALAQVALLEGTTQHSPDVIARAALTLNRTCLALCEGQSLDLESQAADALDVDSYMTMVRGKTGALFGCATELGALLAGATPAALDRWRALGETIGVAFQIQDDIIGVWGAEAETGKLPMDVVDHKRGLPAVLAWQRAKGADLERLRALYSRTGPLQQEEVAWVLALFDRLGLTHEAQQMAREQLQAARQVLREVVGSTDEPTMLHAFLEQLMLRDK